MTKFKFGDKVSYRSCKNAFYLRKTDDIRSLIAVEKFGAIKGALIRVITNELTPASDKKMIKCSACNGSGYYDELDLNGNHIPCGACHGIGKVKE